MCLLVRATSIKCPLPLTLPSILSAYIASLQLFKRVEGNNYIGASSQFATWVMPYFSNVSGSMGR